MKTTARPNDILDNCKVEDCCQMYTVRAHYWMERGCIGEVDRPRVTAVEIHKATCSVFGTECEMIEPADGWPQILKDYLCRELEQQKRFNERVTNAGV